MFRGCYTENRISLLAFVLLLQEVVHTVGKKFMTKDMRESAQKMAKRAMKGKSMRVV